MTMRSRCLLLLGFVLLPRAGFGATFGYGDILQVNEGVSLLVTHPSSEWDVHGVAKEGVRDAIRLAQNRPGATSVYYLVSKNLEQALDAGSSENERLKLEYYVSDLKPTAYVLSSAGEHNIRLYGHSMILAGGFFGSCLRRSFSHLLKSLEEQAKGRDVRLYFPAEAIYFTVNQNLADAMLSWNDSDFSNEVEQALHLADPVDFRHMAIPSSVIWRVLSAKGSVSPGDLGIKTNASSFHFSIYRGHRLVAELGAGPISVDLVFESLRDVFAEVEARNSGF
jgi:hypothetical protein